MKIKILALLLVFAMLFSLPSCSSATDDEDKAVAGTISQENSDKTDDTDANENKQPVNNDTADKTPPENEKPLEDTKNPEGTTPPADEKPDTSEKVKYTVTFNHGYDNIKNAEKTDGKLTESVPERPGYKFEGWFDGDEKWNFSNEVTKNMTLKAKWSVITYNITYDLGGATLSGNSPTTYTVEKDVNLGVPSKFGKLFVRWNIKSDDKTLSSDSIPKGTTGDLTISPVWDETVVVLGKYEQDNNRDNGKEDIVWLKIKEENGKALLISKQILDAMAYDTNNSSAAKWENCTIRSWLNSNFYQNAFDVQEKEVIIKTTNQTPGNFDGSVTEDYTFLLSLDEAGAIMKTYAPRYAKPTAYAQANGALLAQATSSSPESGWWWLRTKNSEFGAVFCESNGLFSTKGYNTKLENVGVRPCIRVDLSKLK